MVPAGNKVERLSSVNHSTKTIHHHLHVSIGVIKLVDFYCKLNLMGNTEFAYFLIISCNTVCSLVLIASYALNPNPVLNSSEYVLRSFIVINAKCSCKNILVGCFSRSSTISNQCSLYSEWYFLIITGKFVCFNPFPIFFSFNLNVSLLMFCSYVSLVMKTIFYMLKKLFFDSVGPHYFT